MGKKIQHKKFRRIAKGLPEVMVWSSSTEKVLGSKLLEEGVTTLKNGRPIFPNRTYQRKFPTPINHERMLKRAYDESGNKGVTDYIAEVNKIHKQQAEQSQSPYQVMDTQEIELAGLNESEDLEPVS